MLTVNQLLEEHSSFGEIKMKTATFTLQIHRRGRNREFTSIDISPEAAPPLPGRK